MILRTIHCDVPGCAESSTEPAPNRGWLGWGQLDGITVGEKEVARTPNICPQHLQEVATKFFGEEKT